MSRCKQNPPRSVQPQTELAAAVACQCSDAESNQHIQAQQGNLYSKYSAQMLLYQLRMLSYIACVVVGYPQVEQDVQYIAEAEYGEVETIHLVPNGILHAYLNAQKPERLDDEVCEENPE